MSELVELYTDGASRGNPGPASVGASLVQDGAEIATVSEAIGMQTNNYAEYSALIAGLQKASELKLQELVVKADSELMIKQLRGEYKVKNANIKPLFMKVIELAKNFKTITYTHVRREQNKRADQLANLALD